MRQRFFRFNALLNLVPQIVGETSLRAPPLNPFATSSQQPSPQISPQSQSSSNHAPPATPSPARVLSPTRELQHSPAQQNLETVAAFLTEKVGQKLNEMEVEGMLSLLNRPALRESAINLCLAPPLTSHSRGAARAVPVLHHALSRQLPTLWFQHPEHLHAVPERFSNPAKVVNQEPKRRLQVGGRRKCASPQSLSIPSFRHIALYAFQTQASDHSGAAKAR